MKGAVAFKRHLKKDILIIFSSVIFAVLVTRSGVLPHLLLASVGAELFGVFIAGILFTSLFTTPLAIAAFISLAPNMHPVVMAALGAGGALVGDLLLFLFIRHTFREDVEYILNTSTYRRYTALFRRRTFRWIIPFIGALIIASPLPDEFGVALMGVSRMKISTLISISYLMNFLGILFIGLLI